MQKIILVQLGSPKSPQVDDVRAFLKEFLSDPRLVDLPAIVWRVILYLFILPFRSPKVAKLYRLIWSDQGFPLTSYSELFAKKLQQELEQPVVLLYRYGDNSIRDFWKQWDQECAPQQSESWLVIPMYPQYCECTTASVFDVFYQEGQKRVNLPQISFVNHFYQSAAYLDSCAQVINNKLEKIDQQIDLLLLSFHGVPEYKIKVKGDPYYYQCLDTAKLLAARLSQFDPANIQVGFQSRMGRTKWVTPYTSGTVAEQIAQGAKNIAIFCPSFTVDCLETTVEIGVELKNEAAKKGATLHLIPSLNCDQQWIEQFAALIQQKLSSR